MIYIIYVIYVIYLHYDISIEHTFTYYGILKEIISCTIFCTTQYKTNLYRSFSAIREITMSS